MNTLTHLIDAAREAGRYMLHSQDVMSTEKTNTKDFVTIADIKSQDILRQRLLKVEPEAVVLSEEDAEDVRGEMYADDFTGYVLDPIDGTYNFKRDMRESAISIGYIENGQPVRGVIFDPYKDEMYTVEHSKGAFRNDQEIKVSDQANTIGASIATSNSYNDEAMARNLRRHLALYEETGHMPWTSCPGSGVLIMAGVACGRFDIYHHNGLKPWDNAAAFLLVREAGGVVLRLDGAQARFTDTTVLMGNQRLVGVVHELFSRVDPLLLT